MTSPTTPTHADHYLARMRRVLAHIDAHQDEDLDVARLSSVAAFSPFHFQRQFSALFGLSVAAYVRGVRLKRAGMQLAFREGESVTDIAFDAGYGAAEAFTRAFSARQAQSPSGFRAAPDWAGWHSANAPLNRIRREHMTRIFTAADVTIVNFPATHLAVLPHRGDPALLGDTIRRFIDWRRANGLPPAKSATFSIFHNDPEEVAPEDHRTDLACAFTGKLPAASEGFEQGELAAGRCARLRQIGSGDDLRAAFAYLYGEWLPASGEEPRDTPPFAQRISFYPDVPAHEAITDLFLPLK